MSSNAMPSDPSQVDFKYQTNTHPNLYPLINQPQFQMGNNYQSYQTPPPYPQPQIINTPYVQPAVYYHGQTALHPQANIVIIPTYQPLWMNRILTTITPNLRLYFIISGIIYLMWSSAAISIDIYLIINSYSTYYRGIWAGSFLLSGGICMLVVACRTSYCVAHMIKIFVLVLFFCIVGLILSAINYSTTRKCSSFFTSKYTCDTEIVRILKTTILTVFVVATGHTLMNIIVVTNEQKKTMLKATTPSAPNP